MALSIRELEEGEVERIVRDVLYIDEKKVTNPEATIGELGAEPMYVSLICYEMGIDIKRYISGGSLNDFGRKLLSQYSKKYLSSGRKDIAEMLSILANSKSSEAIERFLKLRIPDLAVLQHIDFAERTRSLGGVTGVSA